MPNPTTQVDVEFSPALTNRTGKYFICRDMIEELALAVGRVRFWRVNSVNVPDGFRARLLNKLMWWELSARESSHWLRKTLPRIRSANPLIFTDPLQVILPPVLKNGVFPLDPKEVCCLLENYPRLRMLKAPYLRNSTPRRPQRKRKG